MQNFVPVHVYSESSVRIMMSHLQDASSRAVTTNECSRSNLVRHTRTHTGERPFESDQCDYSTTQKGTLVRHKRSHTGEKPYSCTLCEYKTSDSSALNKHMLTHTGVKPFACSECDYRAARKAALTVHMRTHSKARRSRLGVNTAPLDLLPKETLLNT